MARETYLLRDGQLVPKREARPLHVQHGSAPNIRTDGMDPVRCMADGRTYDSKSAYYASVKAHGCEVVGNERSAFDHRPDYRPQNVGGDIKRAIEQLRSRG